jgi:hypothetical protein
MEEVSNCHLRQVSDLVGYPRCRFICFVILNSTCDITFSGFEVDSTRKVGLSRQRVIGDTERSA